MTNKVSGYAHLVGSSHSAPNNSLESTWLDKLAHQLDDTLELIDAELNGDFEGNIEQAEETHESDRLRVTDFTIEEYDWQTVMAS